MDHAFVIRRREDKRQEIGNEFIQRQKNLKRKKEEEIQETKGKEMVAR